MKIFGVVTAKHEGQAKAILMDLVNEGILDYYDLDGREDLPSYEIDERYDAVVDNDGYLTTDEDIVGDLSDLVYCSKDMHTFGFEAEYLEA